MAINEEVKYTLSLHDLLTGKLKEANSSAEVLEGTMSRVEKVLGAIGIGVAIFEIGEYAKEAGEKFELLERATAKTEANLEATGGKAGISMENLSAWATALHQKTGEAIDVLVDAQSQLLTFPSITKDNFQAAMTQVEDIAKQTNKGVTETAIMYGKALADPAEGLNKLTRYGVILNEQEKKRVTDIQATNGTIAAQAALMELINHSGYEGVAAKMFDADPLGRYKLAMQDTEIEVGRMVKGFKEGLAPSLESAAHAFRYVVEGAKSTVEWLHQNEYAVKGIEAGFIAVGTAIAGYTLYMQLAKVETAYVTGMIFLETLANEGLAASFVAVGISATTAWAAATLGISVVIAGIVAAYYHSFILQAAFAGIGAGLSAFGKYAGEIFHAVGKLMWDIASGQVWKAGDDFSALKKVASDTGTAVATAYHNTYTSTLADLNKNAWDKKTAKKPEVIGKAGAAGADGAVIPTASKAQGTKSVTVNITINGGLVHEMKIMTTNISEGAGKIKEHVANALAGALNDSQIVADI